MPKRTDANQAEIVAALRDIPGCFVADLHEVGRGCPDLLVGFRGVNYLMEVKSARGKLTGDEQRWQNFWPAPVHIVRSVEDALEVVNV